jgi:hypothetical protein
MLRIKQQMTELALRVKICTNVHLDWERDWIYRSVNIR